MSTHVNSAQQFFEACETGKGWNTCSSFCHPDATFASQTTALADISTLEGYCEWMKNLLTPIPDGHYELKFFAADEARDVGERHGDRGVAVRIEAMREEHDRVDVDPAV